MSDANKSSGFSKLETEADWVIDLDKLAEETGIPSSLSIVPLPRAERSSQDHLLEGVTGTEFFRLASETPVESSHAAGEESQSYQDLQYQNEQLLDWISELEESLSQCQSALQFQRQRSQELEAIVAQRQKSDSITSADAGLNRAFQDAQQQVQKQKILVETLTQQLDNAKERVSHLEQDCSSLQKRFADQTQRLVQSENECRSLKTRLSRQQRYTLQFKAALERCLEVSVPLPADIDAPEDSKPASPALPEPVTFFPRSSPVQPWTAQEETEDVALEGSWHKVTQWVETIAADPSAIPESTQPVIREGMGGGVIEENPVADRSVADRSVTEGLEEIDRAIEDSTLTLDPPVCLRESLTESLTKPLTKPLGKILAERTEPALPQPAKQPISLPSLDPLDAELQAVMNPTPELHPEPYQLWQHLAQTTQPPDGQPPEAQVTEATEAQVTEATEAQGTEGQVTLGPIAEPPSEVSSPEPAQPRSAASEPSLSIPPPLPSKVKLIAFPSPKPSFNLPNTEAVQEAAPNPLPENPVAVVSTVDRPHNPLPDPLSAPRLDLPEARPTAEPRPSRVTVNPLLDNNSPSSLNLQPSWPSPLVYPLRPPKKRNSLAAIELPRFPQR